MDKSLVKKRSIVLDGHKTSVSLEEEFWVALGTMAGEMGLSMSAVATAVDRARQHGNLSSALRLAIFRHFDRRKNG